MKKIFLSVVCLVMVGVVLAQDPTGDRMQRDLKVAEGVLESLIKQQFEKGDWLPVSVEASYRSGYGVTFSIPNFSNFPMNYITIPRAPRAPRVHVQGGQGQGYTYSIETDEEGEVITEELRGKVEENRARAEEAMRDAEEAMRDAEDAMERSKSTGFTIARSSVNSEKDAKEYNKLLTEASKTFLADYSSILSQLKPEEKVIITNRATDGGNRYWRFMGDEKRYFLSIEASGADIKQFQVGKLNRDQFVSKIKVVESEVMNERSQDLELLTTIFDRLYQPDLSSTFFTEDNTYYERLKDYGVIYHMQVYSSNQLERGYFNMPTQKLEKVTEEQRNQKVKELYPNFEKELKENILEYGRTIKSLKPEEVLVFNVRLTKCSECGIPSMIEIVTKASVLADYLSGKLDKNGALGKMELKKGPLQ